MRTDYVYVMRRGDGAHKIGHSTNPVRRRATLSKRGAPVQLLHTVERPGDAQAVEHLTHTILRDRRLGGEWFDVDDAAALAAIHRVIRDYARDVEIVVPYERTPIRCAVLRVAVRWVEQRTRHRLTPAEVTRIEASQEMAAYQRAVADEGLSLEDVETGFRVQNRDIMRWISILFWSRRLASPY